MARSRGDGTTILSGTKAYEVGKVSENEGKMTAGVRRGERKPTCPYCSSAGLYRHSGERKALHRLDRRSKGIP